MTQTPERDCEFEKATYTVITKMMLVLPTQKVTESAAEARIEAFVAAAEDLPWWAVAAAIRGWYRGRYGDEHDYTWQPGPATLRRIAHLEGCRVASRIRELKSVLNAEELVTYSAEHREQMVGRLKTVIPWLFAAVGGAKLSDAARRPSAPECEVAGLLLKSIPCLVCAGRVTAAAHILRAYRGTQPRQTRPEA
jgi:hypothetical protein